MKKRFNRYMLPPWMQKVKRVCGQFIIPFTIFQGIRTLLLPTTFDILLLIFFILIALALYFEMI